MLRLCFDHLKIGHTARIKTKNSDAHCQRMRCLKFAKTLLEQETIHSKYWSCIISFIYSQTYAKDYLRTPVLKDHNSGLHLVL
jgi:hypothetical protein